MNTHISVNNKMIAYLKSVLSQAEAGRLRTVIVHCVDNDGEYCGTPLLSDTTPEVLAHDKGIIKTEGIAHV